MKTTFKSTIFSLSILTAMLLVQQGCKTADSTPLELQKLKNLMIAQPTEEQDSITHLLSKFMTDFIPASSNPNNFKYFSRLSGNKFILLVDIPWINVQPKEDQEAVIRVVPMVLDLNEDLKTKEIFVGIYGEKGISMIKTPDGEYYGSQAKQDLLMSYFN